MDLIMQKSLFDTNGNEIFERMKELRISQEILEESLVQIENWFKLQPHLPNINKDDPYVLKYLFMTSFSIEKTKSKLENLFTARSITSEFFKDRDPCSEETKRLMDSLQFAVVPKVSINNHRTLIVRFPNDRVDLYDPLESFRTAFMLMDMRLEYDTNFNDVYIADLSNMKIGHVLKLNPLLLKNILTIVQNCYVNKIVSVHVVNVPQYSLHLIKLTRSLLKKKINERFYIHETLDDLYRYIPKDELPSELGGKADSCADICGKIYEAMKSNMWRERLVNLSNVKSDESRRSEKNRIAMNDKFGIDGSFKKLDID